MPESEGSLFVTTSGGWSSYFGDAPNKWDSRESSLPTMKRSYVPYVVLTDSERGFSVFMDNDKDVYKRQDHAKFGDAQHGLRIARALEKLIQLLAPQQLPQHDQTISQHAACRRGRRDVLLRIGAHGRITRSRRIDDLNARRRSQRHNGLCAGSL